MWGRSRRAFSLEKKSTSAGFAAGTLLVDQSASVNAAGANVHVSGGVNGTQTSAPGTLTVKNGASLTANTVTVYQNGTLNGNGTITGNVVLSGGTIAPGNSPGTETIAGNLSLLTGVLDLEIASDTLADHLNVSGTVFIGQNVVFNLIFEYAPSFNHIFSLESFFTPGGGLTFDPGFNLASHLTTQGLPGGSSIVVTADDQRTTVTTAAAGVPEPASIAILLAGLGGLAAGGGGPKPKPNPKLGRGASRPLFCPLQFRPASSR